MSSIPWLVRGTVPLSDPPAPATAEPPWASPGEAATPSPAPILSATPAPVAAPGGSAARAQAPCVRGSPTQTQTGADPSAHPPAPPLAQPTATPLSPAAVVEQSTGAETRWWGAGRDFAEDEPCVLEPIRGCSSGRIRPGGREQEMADASLSWDGLQPGGVAGKPALPAEVRNRRRPRQSHSPETRLQKHTRRQASFAFTSGSRAIRMRPVCR